jgi:hypothetical protein
MTPALPQNRTTLILTVKSTVDKRAFQFDAFLPSYLKYLYGRANFNDIICCSELNTKL